MVFKRVQRRGIRTKLGKQNVNDKTEKDRGFFPFSGFQCGAGCKSVFGVSVVSTPGHASLAHRKCVWNGLESRRDCLPSAQVTIYQLFTFLTSISGFFGLRGVNASGINAPTQGPKTSWYWWDEMEIIGILFLCNSVEQYWWTGSMEGVLLMRWYCQAVKWYKPSFFQRKKLYFDSTFRCPFSTKNLTFFGTK